MQFTTPNEIESIAWEGELVEPEEGNMFRGATGSGFRGDTVRSGPVCAIGKPEVWAAEDAVEALAGQPWTPPLGGARFWLVRLACTLREPEGRPSIIEAQQTLFLQPVASGEDADAYAYSLIPDRLGVEDKAEIRFALGLGLKFAGGMELKAGEIGATIDYRKVFPVIQGYGAGKALCEWKFKPHRQHPIDGTQFVYAVVAAKPDSNTVRATLELRATVESTFGPITLGPPEEARTRLTFTIPE